MDRHAEKASDGMGCDVATAVSWSDGPTGCACERCIPPGTPCSVDGCDASAVHYRMNHDKSKAFDMCVRHYEEAEPYCERYYELTGGTLDRLEKAREADGCGRTTKHVHHCSNHNGCGTSRR